MGKQPWCVWVAGICRQPWSGCWEAGPFSWLLPKWPLKPVACLHCLRLSSYGAGHCGAPSHTSASSLTLPIASWPWRFWGRKSVTHPGGSRSTSGEWGGSWASFLFLLAGDMGHGPGLVLSPLRQLHLTRERMPWREYEVMAKTAGLLTSTTTGKGHQVEQTCLWDSLDQTLTTQSTAPSRQ